MNWGLIGWVAGTLLTLYAIKFVWIAIRALFSKKTMEKIMVATGDGVERANDYVVDKITKKIVQRKQQKQEKKNEPMIYIR